MSSEMLNLIVGASIALFSSLMTAFVTHILHLGREKKKRTWELEDLERNQRIGILKERIAQAEAWVEGYVKYIDQTQHGFLFIAKEPSDFGLQDFREWLSETLKIPQEYSYRKAAIYRLNDPELLELVKELDQYWIKSATVLRPPCVLI